MQERRVTVKDIATEYQASLSTVTKALAGKSGVSEKKREEILALANRMGYKVNKVAQSLARGEIRIGVIIPEDWPQFYKRMETGISEELARLSDFNVSGIFRYFSHSEKSHKNIMTYLDELLKSKLDAIILCPIYYHYTDIVARINNNNIPLILLGSDLDPEEHRLSCVRVNADLSGRLAADIVKLSLAANKSAAVFIGNKDVKVHQDKSVAFMDSLLPDKTASGVFETQDDPELMYVLTKMLLRDREEIGAIYVASGNFLPVCKCIEDNGAAGRVYVVSTDIYPEQVSYMEKGILSATIYQNSELQGRLAVQSLFSYISEKILPPSVVQVPPQIVLKSNFDWFL